ncbi:unnamed protein product [Schistosoma margrebowiei]|uniref:Uncharacterized protein n=1 Tax=Schistosoma margrebowiei TaxID=48269 RepID=A0A183LZT2_9TREM|nr:unnamed protein product [Schistosoma margrebowiei]
MFTQNGFYFNEGLSCQTSTMRSKSLQLTIIIVIKIIIVGRENTKTA